MICFRAETSQSTT